MQRSSCIALCRDSCGWIYDFSPLTHGTRDPLNTLLLLVVVVIFASLATAWAGAVRSASLRRKFEALGTIPGRSMQEIVRHVGEPDRRHSLHAGREVLEWRRINFRVTLRFSADACDSVEYDAGG